MSHLEVNQHIYYCRNTRAVYDLTDDSPKETEEEDMDTVIQSSDDLGDSLERADVQQNIDLVDGVGVTKQVESLDTEFFSMDTIVQQPPPSNHYIPPLPPTLALMDFSENFSFENSNKKQVDCDPEYFGVDGDIFDGDGMMVGQTFDGMYDHDHDQREIDNNYSLNGEENFSGEFQWDDLSTKPFYWSDTSVMPPIPIRTLSDEVMSMDVEESVPNTSPQDAPLILDSDNVNIEQDKVVEDIGYDVVNRVELKKLLAKIDDSLLRVVKLSSDCDEELSKYYSLSLAPDVRVSIERYIY